MTDNVEKDLVFLSTNDLQWPNTNISSKKKMWKSVTGQETCKISGHFATVVIVTDLKPSLVHNGTLSEGEGSLFASESSLRAAGLQCGSQVPAEYFALRVETTLLCCTVFSVFTSFQYDTVFSW